MELDSAPDTLPSTILLFVVAIGSLDFARIVLIPDWEVSFRPCDAYRFKNLAGLVLSMIDQTHPEIRQKLHSIKQEPDEGGLAYNNV